MNNFSTIILAAGLSSRIGFPKAFLQWDENICFLEKIIREYQNFNCSEIIVVLNDTTLNYYISKQYKFLESVKTTINKNPELPRFLSVQLGLQNVSSDYCFIQNIDSPFIDTKTLDCIFAKRNIGTFVSPVVNEKHAHPVLLGKDVIKSILHIKNYDSVLSDCLNKFQKTSVTVKNKLILCNINTMEDYTKYFHQNSNGFH